MGPGICGTCGLKPRHNRGMKLSVVTGLKIDYRRDCYDCHFSKEAVSKKMSKTELSNSKHAARKHKKTYCENVDFRLAIECKGFAHWSQLELDHIDGNPRNNKPWNHQTLCSNCHSYKTHMDRIGDVRFAKLMAKQIEKNKAAIDSDRRAISLERFMEQPATKVSRKPSRRVQVSRLTKKPYYPTHSIGEPTGELVESLNSQ